MKQPTLSNGLNEELSKQSKKEKRRRIIFNSSIFLVIIIFAILAKVFIFKGDIKIKEENTKSPQEKIETVPELSEDKKPQETTTTTTAPPPTTTTTTPPTEPKETVYVVKEGDTLSQIANQNGMTSKQLMDYNGLVDPNLMPGQNIKIPK